MLYKLTDDFFFNDLNGHLSSFPPDAPHKDKTKNKDIVLTGNCFLVFKCLVDGGGNLVPQDKLAASMGKTDSERNRRRAREVINTELHHRIDNEFGVGSYEKLIFKEKGLGYGVAFWYPCNSKGVEITVDLNGNDPFAVPPAVPRGEAFCPVGSDCEPYCSAINKIVYENACLFGTPSEGTVLSGGRHLLPDSAKEYVFQDDAVRFHVRESDAWDYYRVYVNASVWDDVPPYLREMENAGKTWNHVYSYTAARDLKYHSSDMLTLHIPGSWLKIVEQYSGAYDRWHILQEAKERTKQRSSAAQAVRDEAAERERQHAMEYELKNGSGDVVFVRNLEYNRASCSPVSVHSAGYENAKHSIMDVAETLLLKKALESYPVSVSWRDFERTRSEAERVASSLNRKLLDLLSCDGEEPVDPERLFIRPDGNGSYCLAFFRGPDSESKP